MVDYHAFGRLRCLFCGSARLVLGEVAQEQIPALEAVGGTWLSAAYHVHVHVECLACAHHGFVNLEQTDEVIDAAYFPAECPPGCPDEATHQG